MTTPSPVTITNAWALRGDPGHEYLIDIHDGFVRIAFDDSTPDGSVLGHSISSGDVVTPPTGMSLYLAAANGLTARVTVTQGDVTS